MPAEPTPDELRAIAREARNSSGSASDDCGSAMYVLYGWRAAISKVAPPAMDGGEVEDAARYRWLRERSSTMFVNISINGEGAEIAATLDSAVDAARAAQKEQPMTPNKTPTAESVSAVDEAYKQVLWSKNCMQCCVGYMLGLPLESVPDFAADGGWDRFASFAESQGYAAVMLPGNPEFEADYLASGTTTRGTSHMVVMNDGKLVHDPHPSNAGLVEVQCVWLLAKKAGPQWHHDERAAFEAGAKAFTSNVSFKRDGTGYADMTAELLWHGWKLRASHGQAPASVLHLVHSAFAEIAMAFPKAFALHKVGIADTAVREALAAPVTARAAQKEGSTQ